MHKPEKLLFIVIIKCLVYNFVLFFITDSMVGLLPAALSWMWTLWHFMIKMPSWHRARTAQAPIVVLQEHCSYMVWCSQTSQLNTVYTLTKVLFPFTLVSLRTVESVESLAPISRTMACPTENCSHHFILIFI